MPWCLDLLCCRRFSFEQRYISFLPSHVPPPQHSPHIHFSNTSLHIFFLTILFVAKKIFKKYSFISLPSYSLFSENIYPCLWTRVITFVTGEDELLVHRFPVSFKVSQLAEHMVAFSTLVPVLLTPHSEIKVCMSKEVLIKFIKSNFI